MHQEMSQKLGLGWAGLTIPFSGKRSQSLTWNRGCISHCIPYSRSIYMERLQKAGDLGERERERKINSWSNTLTLNTVFRKRMLECKRYLKEMLEGGVPVTEL